MIKKTLSTLCLSAIITLSSGVVGAADLEQNMKTLGKNYKAFNQANTQQEALTALNNMQVAAVDAKTATPHSLHGLAKTDAKVQGYQAELDKLIAGIQESKTLVQDNKLAEAKVAGKKLAEIKDEGHQLYK
ncbi:cytochrome b562 [Acinetobacter sp. ANC 3832]|uniref:cytochrome b562 n=1 Tax=Acinetobacter sp. ANC 3832 TaxID=1977874 RepID=UPI000A333534|nr:cytochrome b562 [Acinetobacter sp. ANC 3832]OTG94316.1 hypothetical protein B9T35_07880 [Acinetobacter sp. ANC 3832]